MATEYGYIRWRSTLTGAEGGGQRSCCKPRQNSGLHKQSAS